MTLDTLRLVRNILLRTFAIGVAFAFILAFLTFGAWDSWIVMATQVTHTAESTLAPVVLSFFTELRFFLLFILLAPALAIHWTIKKEIAKREGLTSQGKSESSAMGPGPGNIAPQH